jgi:hypothetical protein
LVIEAGKLCPVWKNFIYWIYVSFALKERRDEKYLREEELQF